MAATNNGDAHVDLSPVDIDTSNPQLQGAAAIKSEAESYLRKFDEKGFHWFHVKAVMVAGMGFFCDAYDLFSIGLVTKNIGRIYYPDWQYYSPSQCAAAGGVNPVSNPDHLTHCGAKYSSVAHFGEDSVNYVPSALPTGISSALNAVALFGAVTGQLIFGVLGDRIGRKPCFVASLCMLVVFGALQGLTFGEGTTAVITSLCIFRFFLGVGIGGEYPLSATLMSEFAGKNNRGALVAAVFAMQGWGYLAAGIFCLIISAIFENTNSNPDYIWRIVLAFSAVPAIVTMYARLRLPETPRYSLFTAGQTQVATRELQNILQENSNFPEVGPPSVENRPGQFVSSYHKVSMMEFISKFKWTLLGTAGSWFLIDIAFYSQGLFQNTIYSATGWVPAASTMTASQEVQALSRAQVWISLASIIPGYWTTVLLIDRVGRKPIQYMGFFMVTVFLAILTGDYISLQTNPWVFIALYCMVFYFINFGPNTTTYVIPSEVYPTRYRTTGAGISAAGGKLGAAVGTFGFNYMVTGVSLQAALGLICGVCFMGIFTTMLVPEGRGVSLEELNNDELVSAESSYNSSYESTSFDSIDKSKLKVMDYPSEPTKAYLHQSGAVNEDSQQRV